MYVNIVILVKYSVFIFSINIYLYRENILINILYFWRLNMNKYMIIRSDNKSISPPMTKHEAIIKLKEYNKKGISTYLVSRSEYINIIYSNKSNTSLSK